MSTTDTDSDKHITSHQYKHVAILKTGFLVATDSRLKNMIASYQSHGYRVTLVCQDPNASNSLTEDIELRIVEVRKGSQAAQSAKLRRRLARMPFARSPAEVRSRRRNKKSEIDEIVSTIKVGKLGRSARLKQVGRVRFRRFMLRARRPLEDFSTRRYVRHSTKAHESTTHVNWRQDAPRLWDYERAFGPVLDELDPDIIQAQDTPLVGVAARAAKRAEANGRTPITVADILENWAGLPMVAGRTPRLLAAYIDYESEYLPEIDIVITVNSHVERALRMRNQVVKDIQVVMNCPDASSFQTASRSIRDQMTISADSPLLVYAGGINKARGLDIAIESLQFAPDFNLAIVSVPYPHGMQDALLKLAKKLGVEDRVTFLPPANSNEIISYLSSADIGLIPVDTDIKNHREGTPNKLFEYAHAGLPIVSSRIEDVENFVTENNFGEVFDYPNSEALAKAYSIAWKRTCSGDYSNLPGELLQELSWKNQVECVFETISELEGNK